jgi:hypothetical protein
VGSPEAGDPDLGFGRGVVQVFSTVDGKPLREWWGRQEFDSFGASMCVVNAGDEELRELWIGAPQYGGKGLSVGRGYVEVLRSSGERSVLHAEVPGDYTSFGSSISVKGREEAMLVLIGAPRSEHENEVVGSVHRFLRE